MKRLIDNEDGVYMIDEDCLKRKEEIERQKEMSWQRRRGPKEEDFRHQKPGCHI